MLNKAEQSKNSLKTSPLGLPFPPDVDFYPILGSGRVPKRGQKLPKQGKTLGPPDLGAFQNSIERHFGLLDTSGWEKDEDRSSKNGFWSRQER